jgi:Txe/YoeB family toxin of Txe-Axe toxin-antitoxin module
MCLCIAEALRELPVPDMDEPDKWIKTLEKLEKRLRRLAEIARNRPQEGAPPCEPVEG